jgi:hypothetical protein
VEERRASDGFGLVDELSASARDDAVEVAEGSEVSICQRLVDVGPEVLRGLQLRTVGRLEDEAHALGDDQVLGPVPAGVVELEDDALVRPRADGPGEVGEDGGEERLADGVGDVPDRLAGGGLDEAGEVEPLEAMVAERDRPLAARRPDPARDRLQPEAMLVRRPDLDRRPGMAALLLARGPSELFLSAVRASSPAAAGWRGRGCCSVYSSAISASQPR